MRDEAGLSDPSEALASLHERSLILVEESGSDLRFSMLETLREYAAEQLGEVEREALLRHYVSYFLLLAEQAEPGLEGPDQVRWLDRLEAEHDNLRAALDWCLKAEAGLRLATALARFWYLHGHLREGRAYLEAALSQTSASGTTPARARAYNAAGVLAYSLGDYGAARALHEASLSMSMELGDRGSTALALNRMGLVAYHQGDAAAAKAFYEDGLAIRREMGDTLGVAASLNNLGYVAGHQGDSRLARSCFEESLEVHQTAGNDKGIADNLEGLGWLAGRQGEPAEALRFFAASLAKNRQIGDRRVIAGQLCQVAALAMAQGQAQRAARLYGAAATLWETVGVSLPAYVLEEQERNLTALREALGETAFAVAYESGRMLDWEQAVDEALKE